MMFLTKEAADDYLSENLKTLIKGWYCPVIRNECNSDCYCFSKADIRKGLLFYYVERAHCKYMLMDRGKK